MAFSYSVLSGYENYYVRDYLFLYHLLEREDEILVESLELAEDELLSAETESESSDDDESEDRLESVNDESSAPSLLSGFIAWSLRISFVVASWKGSLSTVLL